jgi:ketopantoate hydroxymethyltransferase
VPDNESRQIPQDQDLSQGQKQLWVTASLTGRVPRFVHKFADLGAQADEAIAAYAAAVRDRSFPGDEYVYR